MAAGSSSCSQSTPSALDEPSWCVYLLRCRRGQYSGGEPLSSEQCHPTVTSVIYTGITKDIEKRWAAHRSGNGAKFTRAHYPLALLAVKPGLTRQQAARIEAEVKRLPAVKKRELACAWHLEFGLPTWACSLRGDND